MHTLVYQSTANSTITDKDLSDILEKSRALNKENNITGCLIYYNYTFLQILESSQPVLEKLILKIEDDNRNYDIKILHNGFVKKRSFEKWHMAYINLSSSMENSAESKLFKRNVIAYSKSLIAYSKSLIAYSKSKERVSTASLLFWREAKVFLEEKEL
jgi:hypothetical protein